MLWSSWGLLRDSGRIFMEGSPPGLDPADVARALAADSDVVEVHDLHVWTVTSGFPALAAHVLVSPDTDCHGARRRLQRLLEDEFHLHHVTPLPQRNVVYFVPARSDRLAPEEKTAP